MSDNAVSEKSYVRKSQASPRWSESLPDQKAVRPAGGDAYEFVFWRVERPAVLIFSSVRFDQAFMRALPKSQSYLRGIQPLSRLSQQKCQWLEEKVPASRDQAAKLHSNCHTNQSLIKQYSSGSAHATYQFRTIRPTDELCVLESMGVIATKEPSRLP